MKPPGVSETALPRWLGRGQGQRARGRWARCAPMSLFVLARVRPRVHGDSHVAFPSVLWYQGVWNLLNTGGAWLFCCYKCRSRGHLGTDVGQQRDLVACRCAPAATFVPTQVPKCAVPPPLRPPHGWTRVSAWPSRSRVCSVFRARLSPRALVSPLGRPHCRVVCPREHASPSRFRVGGPLGFPRGRESGASLACTCVLVSGPREWDGRVTPPCSLMWPHPTAVPLQRGPSP